MERRTFLQTVSAAVGTSALAGHSTARPLDSLPTQLRFEPADETVRDGMRNRKLGKTGEMVSCIGVGGYHLGLTRDEDEAIKIVRAALDAGLNFMDNCWDYHDGLSELRMARFASWVSRGTKIRWSTCGRSKSPKRTASASTPSSYR